MNTGIKDVKNFIHFAAKHLGLTSLPKINLVGSSENSKNAFGHFLSDRKTTTITVRVTGRHPIDIMRTIAHELIHFKQRISNLHSSEQMKEDEANALAGRIMRSFDTAYPNVFKDKPVIKEDMGVAAIGGAVNNIGDKQIAGFDPLLGKKRLRNMVKRKTLEQIKESGNGIFHKSPVTMLRFKSKENTMKSRHSIKNNTNFNKMMKDEGEEEKSDYKMPQGGKKITVGE
jgi:4-hydroxy-3-methylbut-2-en-1-yl diphosphate synthase IspG/GcpE